MVITFIRLKAIHIIQKKILVTGSSGTIGTRLCEISLQKGYTIIGTDIRPNTWSEKINKLTIIADLCESEDLKRISHDNELIIHLAANARVYDLVVDPRRARDNIEMLFNILEYCRLNNIKKFIFASSREVYGNSGLPIHTEEEAFVKNCESPYTASKIAGEAMIHAYHQCYGIDFIILRFSNVYGMYDDSDRVIPLFIKKTMQGKDLLVYGEDKCLDFTYIDDTVDGIIRAVERFDEVKNNVINIASGVSVTILSVAEQIIAELKGTNTITIGENRPGEVIQSSLDITKARTMLGYEPKNPIDEGIKRSIEWYREHFYS